MLTSRQRATLAFLMPKPTPAQTRAAVTTAARAMQLASAAARKGTPLARRLAANAGRSIGKAAAKLRSAKAHAARWGHKLPAEKHKTLSNPPTTSVKAAPPAQKKTPQKPLTRSV